MKQEENIKFPFTKTAIRFGLFFVIIFIAIDILFSVFSDKGLNGYLAYFTEGHWKMYLVAKITGGAIYGVFMAFIMKMKAKKMKS